MEIVTLSVVLIVGILIGFAMSSWMLKKAHRMDWEDLISRLNHTGRIPLASTALGLIKLVLLVVSKCIESLEKLSDKQDPIINSVILELRSLRNTELLMLHNKVEEFLKAQRDHLNDFKFKQK